MGSDLFNFVLDSVTQNYDEYLDEPTRFIRNSIEEFADNNDAHFVNTSYNDIIYDLETCITEYELKYAE